MDPDSDPGGPETCGSGFGSATMLEILKQTYLIFIIEEQDLDPDPIIKCTDSRRQMLFNISVLWIPGNLVRIWIRTFRIRIKIRIRF